MRVDPKTEEAIVNGKAVIEGWEDGEVTLIQAVIPANPKELALSCTYGDDVVSALKGTLSFDAGMRTSPTFQSRERIEVKYANSTFKATGDGLFYRTGKSRFLVESTQENATLLVPNGNLFPHGSYGWDMKPARIRLQQAGKDRVILQNRQFQFGVNDNLKADGTELIINVSDSVRLVHPAADVSVNFSNGELVAILDPKKGERCNAPWISPYHGLYMWGRFLKINGDKVVLSGSMINGEFVPVTVSSIAAFSLGEMHRFEITSGLNPITSIMEFQQAKGAGARITPEAVVDLMLVNTSHSKEDVLASLRAMLPKLVAAGYCNFDPASNEIRTTQMLEASNAAATKQKVWDSLSIQLTNLHHGQIEMVFRSNEIAANGAEPFYLTPETKVQVREGKLVFNGNRDIAYFGKTAAGKVLLESDSITPFAWSYAKRQITVVNATAVLASKDEKDLYLANAQHLKIEQISGIFHAQRLCSYLPSNANARPTVLEVQKPAYVYFDDTLIQKGYYDRRLNFELKPFVLKNVESLQAKQLFKPGVMRTSGIFADFEAELAPITTGSKKEIGILKQFKTPVSVYDMGMLVGEVTMGSEGLRNKGKITVGPSVFESENMLLKFDGVSANHCHYRLDDGSGTTNVLLPKLDVAQAEVLWQPKLDVLSVRNQNGSPIRLFESQNDSRRFDGTLMIKSKGVFGVGTLHVDRISIIADSSLQLGVSQASGIAKRFILHDDSGNETMVARDVSLYLDVTTGNAQMTTQNDGFNLAFPIARVWTNLEKIDYDAVLGRASATTANGPAKLCTKRGLHIELGSLEYNTANSTIIAKDVSLFKIGVADIAPADRTLEFNAAGEIAPIQSSQITLGENFIVNDARLLVVDSATYRASGGTVDYHHHDGSISKLSVDLDCASYHSTGKGAISATPNFMLSRQVSFAGTFFLDDSRPMLHFQGEAKLSSSHPAINGKLLPFDAVANSDSVSMKLSSETARTSGLYRNATTGQIYPVVFRQHRNTEDVLAEAGGIMIESDQGLVIENESNGASLMIDEATQRLVFANDAILVPLPKNAPLSIKADAKWSSDFAGVKTSAEITQMEVTIPEISDAAWKALAKAFAANDGDRLVAEGLPLSFPKALILGNAKMKFDTKESAHFICGEAELRGIAGNAAVAQKVQIKLKVVTGAGNKDSETLELEIAAWDNGSGSSGPTLWLSIKGDQMGVFSNVTEFMDALDAKKMTLQPIVGGQESSKSSMQLLTGFIAGNKSMQSLIGFGPSFEGGPNMFLMAKEESEWRLC